MRIEMWWRNLKKVVLFFEIWFWLFGIGWSNLGKFVFLLEMGGEIWGSVYCFCWFECGFLKLKAAGFEVVILVFWSWNKKSEDVFLKFESGILEFEEVVWNIWSCSFLKLKEYNFGSVCVVFERKWEGNLRKIVLFLEIWFWLFWNRRKKSGRLYFFRNGRGNLSQTDVANASLSSIPPTSVGLPLALKTVCLAPSCPLYRVKACFGTWSATRASCTTHAWTHTMYIVFEDLNVAFWNRRLLVLWFWFSEVTLRNRGKFFFWKFESGICEIWGSCF